MYVTADPKSRFLNQPKIPVWAKRLNHRRQLWGNEGDASPTILHGYTRWEIDLFTT